MLTENQKLNFRPTAHHTLNTMSADGDI